MNIGIEIWALFHERRWCVRLKIMEICDGKWLIGCFWIKNPAFRRDFKYDSYSKVWITRPERSLGSNQVVFGGMMLPLSAISIICFIETGYIAKATAISPLSTRRFSSPRPRIPPTKSMRLSVRKSFRVRR